MAEKDIAEKTLEAYNRAEKGKVQTMCDVLDKVEQKGFDKGVLVGEARIEAQYLDGIKGMIQKGRLTVSEGAEMAKMSVEEFERKTGLKSLPS